ncbi:hypothetical protein OCU04_008115 [Sclerotinia nivalis]|uniref:Uncharacterized protein n=1 Tax=Sclerotinia nivalis TaxID=352851 RepID=A0A9X0AHF7_9HELO|nr:hypothetical protein OCU04_008115 [Sclerotinia nivalis]
MSSQASNIAIQGSATLDSNHTSTSTSQTSGAEQTQLSSNRIQAYVNNTDHSTTHASTTQAYTNDQASVAQHYTAAATNHIENFDASFYGNACNGRGR